MAKNRRPLTDDERALWESVATTAKPLRKEQRRPFEPTRPSTRSSAAPAVPLSEARSSLRSRIGHNVAPGSIERRAARKIARGAIAIDARLDLHGLTQANAHARLVRFLERAFDEGGRVVLVITGKGAFGDTGRGVLRRALPDWLSTQPLRSLVASFDVAHRSHGGDGAFYVRLKRNRGL